MPSAQCIYCPEFFDPAQGEGDHVLSSALFGEFEGDVRFRGACTRCNNLFGQFEQEMARCSPLGHYRRIVNANLKRGKKGASILQGPAYGSPAPRFTADFEGESMLVQTSAACATDIEPVDQIIIEDEQGKRHFIQLFDGMTAESLQRRIEQAGVESSKTISCQCNATDAERIHEMIRAVYPSFHIEREWDTEEGNQRLAARIHFQVSARYFQGLAKIAFHYYLTQNHRGLTGNEGQFAPLREFIVTGGPPEIVDRFFTDSGRVFKVPFGERADGKTITSARWCHLIGAIDDGGPIVVSLYLFLGPVGLPQPIFVTLGHNEGRVPPPRGAFAHIFEYDHGRTDRYAGHCYSVGLNRLVATEAMP